MIQAEACRETVVLAEVCLEQQRDIAVTFVGVVLLETVMTSCMMDRTAENQRDIRHLLWVDDEGILGERLIALISDVDEVRIGCHRMAMYILSALTMLLQTLHGSLKDIGVAHIGPAAHERTLSHLGHIGKAVVIVVVSLVEDLIVAQERRTPFVRQLEVGSKVGLQLHVAVEI